MSRLLSYACAATLFAGLIATAGCGGGGGEGSLGASGSVTGRTSSGSGKAPSVDTPVPAAGGVTITVPVTDPATGVTTNTAVTIPSAPIFTNVPANSPLAVLNQGSVLLTGVFGSAGRIGIGGDRASSLASIGTTGVNVDTATGALAQALAVPIAPVTGTKVVLTLPQGNVKTTRGLTIGTTVFEGKFYIDGIATITSPVPVAIDGTLPNDGENAVGSAVTCLFGPGNLGRSATLDVIYGNGFELHQGRNIQRLGANITLAGVTYTNPLHVKFSNLSVDTSAVPAGGISSVSLTIGDR